MEIKLMNEMGYDAMTIGNHEFDFDVDNMARIFKMAKFPVVCANYNLEAYCKAIRYFREIWFENRCLRSGSGTGRTDSG